MPVMQGSRLKRITFDPFPLFRMACGRCDVVQALMVMLIVIMIDEGFDLGFEVTRLEVVFQRFAVLQGLVPAFNLALGLRMIRCAA